VYFTELTVALTDQYIQESKAYYDQLSLYVCRETAHCARLSCGGVIQACRSVCEGEVRNAIAIVRPPGHHAEPDEHMGFCFFNNVAVAAKEIQKQGLAKKVLILDWYVLRRRRLTKGMSTTETARSEHFGKIPVSCMCPYIDMTEANSTPPATSVRWTWSVRAQGRERE